ncbi:hypothetical protein [Dyella sp.]|jgi:hypothetical protein|uniref:hypothetical protein n=1 Tax=Dyella sp. TaxID=1869338 RepID=UPI002D779FFC|nr:hypothetical protein [Dyella sp.]HET6431701.1 hypothetical protein [Dyella sp.]
MNNEAATKSRKRRNTAVLAVAGMIVGAPFGYLVGRLVKHGAPGLHLAWSDVAALAIAAWMIATGLAILVAGSNRRIAGRMADPAEPRPATPAQMRFYRTQSVVLLLAGVLLALPVLVGLLPGGASSTMRMAAMALIVGLFALQTFWNYAIWRQSDEFLRALVADGSIICFWVLQSALLLWASGEKLGLLPAASLWDALVVMMAVYLVVSATLSIRRGMH